MNKTVLFVAVAAAVVLVVWYMAKSKNVSVTGGANLGISAGNNQPPPGQAPTPGMVPAQGIYGLPGSAGGTGDSWSGQQIGGLIAGIGTGVGNLFSGIGSFYNNAANSSPQNYNGGGNPGVGSGNIDYSPADNFDQGAYEVNQQEFWDSGQYGPVAG